MTAEPNDSPTSTVPKPTASDANTTYQQDYSWKLPMTPTPSRLKPERKKSEYQREFAWPAGSPAPSPAPATPEPQKIITTTDSTPAITESARLNAVRELTQSIKTSELRAPDDKPKHNGSFVASPAPLIDNVTTISPVRNDDSWSNSLRKDKSQELRLDDKTKKIVALEANRLSKKSRSQSMYSLHDQLKVLETANDLTNPLESEYRREFVNWTEYGKFPREDGTFNARSKQPTLRRRGSWSAPLPAPLRWLDNQEKLQPTIPNSQSLRAPVKQPPPRPKTSAEFRDYLDFDKLNYTFEPRLSRADFDERSIAKSDKKYSSSPLRSDAFYDHSRLREKDLDDKRRDGDDILADKYDDRRSDRYDDRRSDRLDDRRTDRYDDRRSDRLDDRRTERYDDRKYDDRRNDKYDDRRRDREYDERSAYEDRRGDRYDRKEYDDRYRDREYPDRYERSRDRGYDDRYERPREKGYDDRYERSRNDEYDDRYERSRGGGSGRDYDDRRYDSRRDEREYHESRTDSAYGDRRRDRDYDDRRYGKSHDSVSNNSSSRREDPYDDYRRDRDSRRDRRSDLVYEDSRGDKVYDARRSDQDSRSASHSTVQPADAERYGDRSRNPKYSSGSSRDDAAHSASYHNNSRTRSSQSSLSSASTPSSPATPNGYDTYEPRTKRSSDIDNRSYKEQLYSSSSSRQRSSNIDDDRDRYSNYSRTTSNTPLRKGFSIGDDDEPIEIPSRLSRRQYPADGSSYRDSSTPRGRQTRLYERSPASSGPQSFASSPARSPSPHGEYRRYHHSSITSPNLSPTYSSRPPSRATSVSSHATSIEEESAVLTDMLRVADSATLRSLTDQLSIFRTSRDVTKSSIQNATKGTKSAKSTTAKSTKSTPASRVNRSSLPASATRKASSVRSGAATPRTSSSAASSRKSSVVNGTIPRPTSAPVKRSHKPPSSAASSISSIGSSRGLGATSFSEAREALSKARMKVEEMLELVNNGNYDV